jgi:hypothetical protein
MPGERVQDPFLILDVETRGGDKSHTTPKRENSRGGVETAPKEAQFLSEFESVGEGVASGEEG